MNKPLINTLAVEIMVAPGQNLNFLAVSELAQADAALALLPRALLAVRRRVVQDYGQLLDGGGVKSLRRCERRRVGGGEAALESADPARVDEENSDQEDNGKEHDDEEQGSASDLEVSVIDFRVVPIQRSRIRARHAGDLVPK